MVIRFWPDNVSHLIMKRPNFDIYTFIPQNFSISHQKMAKRSTENTPKSNKNLRALTNELFTIESHYGPDPVTVWKYFQSPDTSADIAKEYENIIRENLQKLHEIAKEDFKNAGLNSRKLTEETKNKLHDLILNSFKSSDSKREFTEATSAIFDNINQKIREDLHSNHMKVEKNRASLSPDVANVFVNPMNKPPEEVEAEKLLQELFEQELEEFNRQIKKDFLEIDCQVNNLVNEAKMRINEKVASENSQEIPKNESEIERHVSGFLKRTANDFEKINNDMTSDVSKNQQMINEKVKCYAEKVFGKDFLNRRLN